MECPKCGMKDKHHGPDSQECFRQQQVNLCNLGEGEPCPWCGERTQLGFQVHKYGCPRGKK